MGTILRDKEVSAVPLHEIQYTNYTKCVAVSVPVVQKLFQTHNKNSFLCLPNLTYSMQLPVC